MKKILISIMALFFIATNSLAEVNLKEVFNSFEAKIQNDSRLNPIRGYMRMQFDKTKLKPDIFLNRKPTESEKKAIAAYIEICEQYFRDIGYQEVKIDQKFEGDDWVSILYKLKAGEITYLDHKKFQIGYDKKSQESLNKIQNPKTLNLVCVFDAPAELAGSEMIVKVDFTNNIIWASKGASQSNFVINDNQFQYTIADDLVTTISRSSGSFTITTPKLGVFGRGNCSESRQKKF